MNYKANPKYVQQPINLSWSVLQKSVSWNHEIDMIREQYPLIIFVP